MLRTGLVDPMHVRGAVQKARSFLEELFQDEGIEDVGLEEVVFDDESNEWKVTIGFTRPWDLRRAAFEDAPSRSYKVIRINNQTESVKSLTDRVLPSAPR